MAIRYTYYFKRIDETFQFLVSPGARVLYYGTCHQVVTTQLQASQCVVVDQYSRWPDPRILEADHIEYHYTDFHSFEPEGTFDYVVLNAALGETPDICQLLKTVSKVCTPSTRIIIYQHNYQWQTALNLAGLAGLKERERTQNWLSIGDLSSYLTAAGFERVRAFRRTLLPVDLGGVGRFINEAAAYIALADPFKLDQFIVARLAPEEPEEDEPSLTICLTVRDERDNIEPIVRALPTVCSEQEILFVEGHSSDGTLEEIERVIEAYPDSNIRVIGQPGKGQGDAIRVGFEDAKGDIVILFEGDGTSDPEDIQYFYDAIRSRRAEFVEGSRFVYPLSTRQMPPINQLGNMLFAKWFSFFLGQNATDVLGGIKAIRRSDFQKIYDNWGFLGIHDPFGDFELLYGAARFGLRLGEVPMRYRPRPYGESKTDVFLHGKRLVRMAARGYKIFRRMQLPDKDDQ